MTQNQFKTNLAKYERLFKGFFPACHFVTQRSVLGILLIFCFHLLFWCLND